MKPIKHNLIMDTFKGVNQLDFITITDKEGNPLDPETEKKNPKVRGPISVRFIPIPITNESNDKPALNKPVFFLEDKA